MSTVHQAGSSYLIYTKGAPSEVLALCTTTLTDGSKQMLGPELRTQILAANDAYARDGLRVLAVAMRSLPGLPEGGYDPELIERDLTFLGLVAMMDPPRIEVVEAVDKCHRAGIRIVMITGDYGLTAESIARRIGIITTDQPNILNGADMEAMDDDTLKTALQAEIIVARAAPAHKLRVVGTLQALGHVVAVTGDGVNDAPALKKADIGVAMGIAGTDVAKEAADMILTDDNFASIVNAIQEGRSVYANIKKFVTLIFTSNAAEAVPFILFAFSRARIPLALNVMEILSIDLGADIVPSLALGAEPPEEGVMDRPPRSPGEHVITGSLLLRAFCWLGPIQALAAMAAFYFHFCTNGYWGQWLDLPSSGHLYRSATAMALGSVVFTQLGNIFAQRTERASVFRIGMFTNPLIWAGIATALVFVSAVIYVPILQRLFQTAAFPVRNYLFLLALPPCCSWPTRRARPSCAGTNDGRRKTGR